MKRKSISSLVRAKVERGGSDRLWTYADFVSLPTLAVAATLTRMAKKGAIRRVRKGVYYTPRETRFGASVPDPSRITAAVLDRRGVAWRHSGLPAYNALGLTTQVSPVSTFAVADRLATPRTNSEGRVHLRSVASVKSMASEERAVLDALRDLKTIPDTTPAATLTRIVELFRSGRISFERVLKFGRKEPPRVRALLGVIGTILGKETEVLKPVRDSLNGTTTFKLNLAADFPEAREWNIR